MHIPHEGQKPELGTDWWWELHCCLGEGRGASREHMELYKLFGAPRKTGKIISSVPETAHLFLQPSGTQSLHGHCLVPLNSHKFLWWGKTTLEHVGKENLLVILLLSASPTWDSCALLAWWLSEFSFAGVHMLPPEGEKAMPKHSFNSPPSNPHSASWNQRGHWCKNSLWFCSPPLKHRWAFPGWWRR